MLKLLNLTDFCFTYFKNLEKFNSVSRHFLKNPKKNIIKCFYKKLRKHILKSFIQCLLIMCLIILSQLNRIVKALKLEQSE